jgi:hypothetical protein
MVVASRRSLWPREHGAYAQLAAPLISALLIAVPTTVSVLLACAAVMAFLTNEPLLVVLGHRGPRPRAADGARARRRLLVLGGLSCALAGVALVLASAPTLRMSAVSALPAAILVVFGWRRAQHSVLGEALAAIALPAAAAPVAVASGVDWRVACLLWLSWSIGYAASVIGVHRVIARHRRAATLIDRMVATVLTAALVGLCIASVHRPLWLLAVPLVGVSAVLVIHPPSARRLRAVGVALVVASAASVGLAVAFAG